MKNFQINQTKNKIASITDVVAAATELEAEVQNTLPDWQSETLGELGVGLVQSALEGRLTAFRSTTSGSIFRNGLRTLVIEGGTKFSLFGDGELPSTVYKIFAPEDAPPVRLVKAEAMRNRINKLSKLLKVNAYFSLDLLGAINNRTTEYLARCGASELEAIYARQRVITLLFGSDSMHSEVSVYDVKANETLGARLRPGSSGAEVASEIDVHRYLGRHLTEFRSSALTYGQPAQVAAELRFCLDGHAEKAMCEIAGIPFESDRIIISFD